MAEARDVPLAQVEQRVRPFWENQKSRLREVKNVEILGTVKRPQVHLTFAKINFTKQPLFMMYVWEGDMLWEGRDMLLIDKEFDYQSDTEFFAPNNQKKISFENTKDGKIILGIKSGDKLVKAIKK